MAKKNLGVQVYTVKPVFSDKRGHIYDLFEEPVSHVGMISFTRGAERGRHYHKKSTQYTYVLSGTIQLTVSDIQGNRKKKFVLRAGSATVIPPRIVHTYKAQTPAVILDMTTGTRKGQGYEKDTFRITTA